MNKSSHVPIWKRIIGYFESRPKLLMVLGALTVGSILGIGFMQNRHKQRELDAQTAIWPAEAYLREGAYDLALEGGGGDMGLLEIIEKFEGTNAGNLAHFYAAVAYLKRKAVDHKTALEHLKAFHLENTFMQFRVWCMIGDIYADQKEYEKALMYYEKSAKHMPNRFTTPIYLFRMALVYEKLKKYEEARACYERVYTSFPKSSEATEAMKHESRLALLAARH